MDRLRREQKQLVALLGDDGLRRGALREQMLATRERFAGDPQWARRTRLSTPPAVDLELLEAPVEPRRPELVEQPPGVIVVVTG